MKVRDLVIVPTCYLLLVLVLFGWKRAGKWLDRLLDYGMKRD